MTVLRSRFKRPALVLLAFVALLVSGPHVRWQEITTGRSGADSGAPTDFSFEQVDRQAILALIDEHRADTDAEWRVQVSDAIYDEAMAAGIDPLLVAAIVARESSFRNRVVSHAGAVGLMQLRPFVAEDLARQNDLEWQGRETLHHPELNVRLGASYYRQLVHRFDGDAQLALAAYHRGPTRLRRQLERGTFTGSQYASRVMELYETLSAGRSDLLLRQG
jgi:soluble lytic murein transglycosylase-like protein